MEAVGIEEITFARWDAHTAVTSALVDEAKQSQQLRPRPVPLVHRVVIPAVVRTQSLIEPGHGVIVRVYGVRGQEVPIFREKYKDHAQQRGHQPRVNVIRITCHDIAQKLPVGLIVSGLETPEQLVKSLEDLAGELDGDNILEFAAALKYRRKALILSHAVQAFVREQHEKCRNNRPSSNLNHVRQVESNVPGGLSSRRIH